MKYFAYGSNMSVARLRERAPGALRLGSFYLRAHALRFHKVGQDGSGKCDALHTRDAAHCVIGALFEISATEKTALDRVEGLGAGYAEKTVVVADASGVAVSASLYYATAIDERLKPYCWYRHHVLVGAVELGLPGHYVQAIEAVETVDDPDPVRAAAQRALHAR